LSVKLVEDNGYMVHLLHYIPASKRFSQWNSYDLNFFIASQNNNIFWHVYNYLGIQIIGLINDAKMNNCYKLNE